MNAEIEVDFMQKDGTMIITENLLTMIRLPDFMESVIRDDGFMGKYIGEFIHQRAGTCGIGQYVPVVVSAIAEIFNGGGALVLDVNSNKLLGGSKIGTPCPRYDYLRIT